MLGIGIGLGGVFASFPSWPLGNNFNTTPPWSRPLVTVTEGVADADGGATAARIIEAAGTGYRYVAQFSAFTSMLVPGATYTVAASMKAGTQLYGYAHIYDGISSRGCSVDLQTGTLGTPYNGATATIASLSGGWYRITARAQVSASATALSFAIGISNANALSSYAGDISKYIDVYNPVFARVG